DSYNNHFVATRGSSYGYTYGIGAESRLVAEHIFLTVFKTVPLGRSGNPPRVGGPVAVQADGPSGPRGAGSTRGTA
ncbi:hypothetical protein ACWDMY_23275, partial [Streptomyces globisporus]